MRRRTWKRRLVLGLLISLSVLVVALVALWIWRPWVPDIEIIDPGPTGRRVSERGVFANYYPAKGAEGGPAILLLGGSEGGISEPLTDVATVLQEEGYSVLTPGYFGVPGQPGNLERVPLETFDRALAWLERQREVDPDKVGVAGVSKGAEAALLVATRHPEVRAVVAGVPSSYVWPGISWTDPWTDSSWSVDGEPLPFLPYGPFGLSFFMGDIGKVYREGLPKRAEHPDAAIPVEDIDAPVLLVCGREDSLWPSCEMARQLKERADDLNGPPIRILAYDDAGHLSVGPPVRRGEKLYDFLDRLGGTTNGNNAARADGWPKILGFARRHLGE